MPPPHPSQDRSYPSRPAAYSPTAGNRRETQNDAPRFIPPPRQSIQLPPIGPWPGQPPLTQHQAPSHYASSQQQHSFITSSNPDRHSTRPSKPFDVANLLTDDSPTLSRHSSFSYAGSEDPKYDSSDPGRHRPYPTTGKRPFTAESSSSRYTAEIDSAHTRSSPALSYSSSTAALHDRNTNYPHKYSQHSQTAPNLHAQTGSWNTAETAVPPSYTWDLIMRQQPIAARACGFGERDRRVIDPPPIVELRVRDANGAPIEDTHAIFALYCVLLAHGDSRDEAVQAASVATTSSSSTSSLPPESEESAVSQRRLMGSMVASPYQAKDDHGIPGLFFVFPDLSCRSPGRYFIRFKLIRIDRRNMVPGSMHANVSTVNSEPFSVYAAKDFPGMRASSDLLKALRRQGMNVGVKKGSDARKNARKDKPRAHRGSASATGGHNMASSSAGAGGGGSGGAGSGTDEAWDSGDENNAGTASPYSEASPELHQHPPARVFAEPASPSAYHPRRTRGSNDSTRMDLSET